MKAKWFKQLVGAPNAGETPATFGGRFRDAAKYWEPWRVIYNVALGLVVIAWVVLTWPHFRPAFTLQGLGGALALAGMANLCYCAAYVADILLQYSPVRGSWRRRRWALWLPGTLFGILLACYWIADEIYDFV
jgi:hypothetical protein